jgi:site-specific recombinase XerD
MTSLEDAEADAIPALVQSSGKAAVEAYRSFFVDNLHNAHTRRAYRRAAEDFFGWCYETAGLGSLAEVAAPHLDGWRQQHANGLAPATARQHLGALRALFRWFAQSGVSNNPTIAFRPASAPAPANPTAQVTAEDVTRLLDSIDSSTPDGARDHALIAVVAELHLAVRQVIGLRCGDVTFLDDRALLRVPAAYDGAAPRTERLTPQATLALRTLLEGHPARDDPASPLFPSMPRGTRRLGRKCLAQADVFRMLQRRSMAAGLPAGISPRALAARVFNQPKDPT